MTGEHSGLWTPGAAGLLRHRATKKTVTLPDGRRALVTTDDSGTVTQIETSDRLDAVVRPRAVRILLPLRSQEDDRVRR